jgi:molecular chaperone Hsp33
MADSIIHATIEGYDVRLLSGVTTELVAEACWRHGTSPTTSAALGRTLTGTLLLGMTQKGLEKVTVQFSCNGPVGGIVALADAYGNVRGYVSNPSAEAPERNGKLNVAGIVGSGTMHVRREAGFEIGLMKEPYHGIVEIVSGEIAADFAYYLTTSEQIPSATSLGVFVNLTTRQVVAAGGYIVQMMPGSSRELADELTRRIEAAPPATDMILEGATPIEMLQIALPDLPIEILETREARFTCTCSRERVLTMLASLERSEVQTMLDDGTGETVTCHVCNESYSVSVDDLRAILATN